MSRVISLVVALPLAAACAHSKTNTAAADAVAPASPAVEAVPAVASVPAGRACSGDDRCGASELCVAQRCVAITPGLAECGATRVLRLRPLRRAPGGSADAAARRALPERAPGRARPGGRPLRRAGRSCADSSESCWAKNRRAGVAAKAVADSAGAAAR